MRSPWPKQSKKMRMIIKTAHYVFDMCAEMTAHYSKVISSCDSVAQLTNARPWIVDGYKDLQTVVESLPFWRRKLLLSVVVASRNLVLNKSVTKCVELLRDPAEVPPSGLFAPECPNPCEKQNAVPPEAPATDNQPDPAQAAPEEKKETDKVKGLGPRFRKKE